MSALPADPGRARGVTEQLTTGESPFDTRNPIFRHLIALSGSGAAIVAAYIADKQDDSAITFDGLPHALASRAEVAAETGMPEGSVRAALKRLQDRGLCRISPLGGRQTQTVRLLYSGLVFAIDQAADDYLSKPPLSPELVAAARDEIKLMDPGSAYMVKTKDGSRQPLPDLVRPLLDVPVNRASEARSEARPGEISQVSRLPKPDDSASEARSEARPGEISQVSRLPKPDDSASEARSEARPGEISQVSRLPKPDDSASEARSEARPGEISQVSRLPKPDDSASEARSEARPGEISQVSRLPKPDDSASEARSTRHNMYSANHLQWTSPRGKPITSDDGRRGR